MYEKRGAASRPVDNQGLPSISEFPPEGETNIDGIPQQIPPNVVSLLLTFIFSSGMEIKKSNNNFTFGLSNYRVGGGFSTEHSCSLKSVPNMPIFATNQWYLLEAKCPFTLYRSAKRISISCLSHC